MCQVVEGTGKVIWELKLNLKVVTVELCLDGEPRTAAREPEKKTLLAQLHDTSFKWVLVTTNIMPCSLGDCGDYVYCWLKSSVTVSVVE